MKHFATLNKENRASKETVLQVMALLAKSGKPVTITTDEDDALTITLLAEFPAEAMTTAEVTDEWLGLQRELSSVEGIVFACSKKRPSGVTVTPTTPPTVEPPQNQDIQVDDEPRGKISK